MTDNSHVEKILAQLRDAPVDTAGASDSYLGPVFSYLMKTSSNDQPSGVPHWFCSRAKQLTVDAATFLLRLFAYDSPRVTQWKNVFERCMDGCCECLQGLEEVKLSSRTTYFGAFADDVLKGFYSSFNQWELDVVLKALNHAGLSSDTANSTITLSNAPSAVVYHMVSNLLILKDPRILKLFHTRLNPDSLFDWPSDPPPPGLLLLALDENEGVRRWAKAQVLRCKIIPIAKDKFSKPYLCATSAITHAVSKGSQVNGTILSGSATPVLDDDARAFANFTFTSDSAELWSGFIAFIRLVPTEILAHNNTNRNINIGHTIAGHLHDTGPHFVDVLKSFLFVLKHAGAGIWEGEGPEFPQVVFDAVKDNPSYTTMISTSDPATDRPWYIYWLPTFLLTLVDLPIYGDVLAKVADFMCEELQHERFRDVRPMVMVAVTRLLSSILRKAPTTGPSNQRRAVDSVLGIHAEILVSVAFGRSYNEPIWKVARVAARELISGTLVKDVEGISMAIESLCALLAGRDTEPFSSSLRQQIWSKTYASLQSNDSEGIAILVSVVSRTAHLEVLHSKSFSPTFHKALHSDKRETAVTALDTINRSLKGTRSDFLDTVSKFANYNNSTSILDFLRRPGVVKAVVASMLSPAEDVQSAAQSLVGQAFDVDVRLDCFRALLENMPEAALEGIFDFLSIFINYATVVPEACNLSKSLVRCLTDVIEVLCAGHDGLLHSQQFLKAADPKGPASTLPKFWNLMTKSITVIFKRTPAWSIYFENETMIVWMRDALIFGRDLLAQRRVFETAAAVTITEQSSSSDALQTSRIGKKMVEDLQNVLLELARWLRLTDEELLHQSFALLQSLLECFRESEVRPSPPGIAKLTKHIDDARKKDPDRPQTRLDSARLSKLEGSLAAFDNENDEIQIISHTVPAPKQKDVSRKTSDSKPKPSMGQTSQRPTSSMGGWKTGNSLPKPAVLPSSSKVNFTGRDQKKLDAVTSFPTFRRQDNLSLPDAIQQSLRRGPASKGEETASSDSDSSSEDEESQRGLAALGKFQKSPKIKKPAERRQVKMLDVDPVSGRSIHNRLNQRNDARRTALRLKPDISALHRALLSWDYDHTGPEPPTKGDKQRLVRVPDKFPDHNLYRAVFEPLLLLECWSQIMQSKDEKQDICECKISSRQFIDDWVDLDVSISEPVPKDWYLAETDVVLLRHADGKSSTLAKVRNYKALPSGIQATLRAHVDQNKPDPGLIISSSWRLSKVFSLSTIHREYAALTALPYYDLFDHILRPRLSPIPMINPRDIKEAMALHKLNEPQAVAILGSMQTEGFALIQGPPGTGKTSTICGLVRTFLSKRPRPIVSLTTGRNPQPQEPPKKILLCAPSNAAIDEVAYRLKESRTGSASPIKVVRVGTEKSITISVKDISLDYLVEQKLNGGQSGSMKDAGDEIASVRAEIESVKRLKQLKLEELSTIHDNTARAFALEDEIKKLNSRRMALSQQFDKLKDKRKHESRSLDATRRKFRSEVLQEADVICSTLSGAGHEVLEQFEFEMVIIDEAAQAIELSSLIPLKFRCQRCIMVGDPQQLPPTVLSQEACKFQYNQSLFVRLQKHHPSAVHLLSIQYRMHPDISQLPSNLFYQGRLQDGPGMAVKTEQPWHSHAKFGTYRFFNVARGQEEQSSAGHSLKNKTECLVAVALYDRIKREFSKVDLDFRVGVVSMYRGQIQELKRAFEQRFGRDIVGTVHFSTVDGFQGQEKDIIILSCVRAGPGLQSVGFLSDTRRMNVALTRAKSSLFILGHAPTLERSDENWRKIIHDARTRSFVVEADVEYFTAPSTSSRSAPQQRRPRASLAAAPAPPPDLTKPRDLANSARKLSLESPKMKQEEVQEPKPTEVTHDAPSTAIEEMDSTAGQKRPALNPTSSDDKRPQAPPPKRFKKEKGSIFIPKKPNKRPAPDGDPSGSSSNRRRI